MDAKKYEAIKHAEEELDRWYGVLKEKLTSIGLTYTGLAERVHAVETSAIRLSRLYGGCHDVPGKVKFIMNLADDLRTEGCKKGRI